MKGKDKHRWGRNPREALMEAETGKGAEPGSPAEGQDHKNLRGQANLRG